MLAEHSRVRKSRHTRGQTRSHSVLLKAHSPGSTPPWLQRTAAFWFSARIPIPHFNRLKYLPQQNRTQPKVYLRLQSSSSGPGAHPILYTQAGGGLTRQFGRLDLTIGVRVWGR